MKRKIFVAGGRGWTVKISAMLAAQGFSLATIRYRAETGGPAARRLQACCRPGSFLSLHDPHPVNRTATLPRKVLNTKDRKSIPPLGAGILPDCLSVGGGQSVALGLGKVLKMLPAKKLDSASASPIFEIAVEDWLRKKASSGRWCPAVEGNARRYARAWKESFHGKCLGDLQLLDVELHETRRAARKGGVSNSAMNQERGFFRQFLKWCRTHGWLSHDPAAAWEPREELVEKKYVPLSLDEELRFVRKARRWLARVVVFAIATGCRLGTCRAVTWGMHTVRLIRGRKVHVLVIPARVMKTRKDHTVVLSEEALRVMGAPGGKEDPIFRLPSNSMVDYWFKKAARAAGIDPACTFHDTRRTFVARLAAVGTPMHVVMKLGGWRRPTTMLTHYCELGEDVALDAVEKIHRRRRRRKRS